MRVLLEQPPKFRSLRVFAVDSDLHVDLFFLGHNMIRKLETCS